jgi:hypothetical protein
MIVGELIPWTIVLVQRHLQSYGAELQYSLTDSSVADARPQTDRQTDGRTDGGAFLIGRYILIHKERLKVATCLCRPGCCHCIGARPDGC